MRSVVVTVALAVSMVLASNAYAESVGIAESWPYGPIDTGTGYKKSTCGTLPQCEEATLAAALGVDVDDVNLTKIDTTLADWTPVDDDNDSTNLVAFDFEPYGIINPPAYIVKVGNAYFDFYLYSNDNSYALIDLNDIDSRNGSSITITSLSHISTVPEAGSLSLLLSGLTALGAVSVRRFRFSR